MSDSDDHRDSGIKGFSVVKRTDMRRLRSGAGQLAAGIILVLASILAATHIAATPLGTAALIAGFGLVAAGLIDISLATDEVLVADPDEPDSSIGA